MVHEEVVAIGAGQEPITTGAIEEKF